MARAPFVKTILVGHVPARQNDDARGKPFSPSSLFRAADFEVDVVTISELLVKSALKAVGPLGVVLDNLLEVVEEFAVGVHPRDLDIGASVSNEIRLEERDGL